MNRLARLRETLYVRALTAAKIPLIAWLRPVVEELSDERCVVRIPLRRRARNHIDSMYFGALCTGADCAGGLIAMRLIQQGSGRVQFVFKDFAATFLKRAEGDVLFTCEDGDRVRELVDSAERSGERVEETVRVTATVPDKLGDEPVAEFELTISLKRKG